MDDRVNELEGRLAAHRWIFVALVSALAAKGFVDAADITDDLRGMQAEMRKQNDVSPAIAEIRAVQRLLEGIAKPAPG